MNRPPRLPLLATTTAVSVVCLAMLSSLPSAVTATSCSAGEMDLQSNSTLQAIRSAYYSHLDVTGGINSKDRVASFVEDPGWAAAYSLACTNNGADYCPRGGSLTVQLTSNVTDESWRVVGSAGLCFPAACCATGTCVVPDDMANWIQQDLDFSLTAWCREDPTLCFHRNTNVEVALSENCVTATVTEVVLLVGIVMGTIILSCACIAFLCRIVKACCGPDDGRHRAESYISLDDSRLEAARERLLAHHVRPYDEAKDRDQGDTCAVCLEPFKSGDDVTEFGESRDACGHIFHADCITQWMRRKDTCPVCRSTWEGGAGGGGP